jgi:hypothetical protein
MTNARGVRSGMAAMAMAMLVLVGCDAGDDGSPASDAGSFRAAPLCSN